MQFSQLFDVYPHIFLNDLLRYLIPASFAYCCFWMVFKNKLVHRFIQLKRPKSKDLQREFMYSMSTVFIFSLNGLGIHTLSKMGYTRIYTDLASYGWTWFILSFVLMTLLHDTYFYWAHRLMHHPKIYRHVHLVHHKSTSPSPWAAYSFHPFEAMIEAGIFWLFVLVMPLHPLALFSFLLYMITRNVLGHLGIELFPKWFLRTKWLSWHTTTTHHDLHHKNFNSNYGLYFSWWDKWMGTEDKNYQETFEEVTQRSVTKKIKKTFVSSASSLCVLLLTTATMAQSPTGLWQTYDEKTGLPLAQIAIQQTKTGLEGKIAKLHTPPWIGDDPICSLCKGDRKDQKIKGMDVLWGFNSEGKGGKILDPTNGVIYTSKIWLSDKNMLKVRGYAGPFNLFYRTQTWYRQGPPMDGNQLTGVWETIDDYTGEPAAMIEIRMEGQHLRGKVIRLFPQLYIGDNAICLNCPGDRKGQKLVGMTILQDLKRSGSRWTQGRILDPGNGKTYFSTVWFKDAETLKVRGYIGPFFRTQTWKRIPL